MSEHSAERRSKEHARAADIVTRANLATYLGDATRKQQLVTPLFDLIAPQYDRFTRVFSYGMDARWKRTIVEWLKRDVGANASIHVLDVACGTGDLALQTARALPNATVRGVDLSEGMLQRARTRLTPSLNGRLTFARGDLMQLDEGAHADVITAGYAIRNAPDPRQALGELAHKLRPGGRLYVLDFFRPAGRVWGPVFLAYLRTTGATIGWLWHRTPAAYEYIAASIEHFATCDEFTAWLPAAGFDLSRAETRLGGGVGLVSARRR